MYLLVLLSVLFFSSANAAEIPYTFVTLDTAVPDHPGVTAFPDDINDDGIVISNLLVSALDNVTVLSNPLNARANKFKNVPMTFSCGDGYATSINDKGQITGQCPGGAFIRQKNGAITILAALGTDAWGFGISSDGYVAGQYCAPNGPPNFGCTLHGFTWHPVAGYQTIDYVDGRPGTHTRSVLLARSKDGKILGEYYVEVDATNETLEHGHFIYDNGFFDTVALPQSFEWRGGEGIFVPDMNDDGQIVVLRWNIPGGDKLQVFDDGKLYDVTLPQGWIIQDLGGMNNNGQFVGMYRIQSGIDPIFEFPIYEHHGFVATPAPMSLADKKGRK